MSTGRSEDEAWRAIVENYGDRPSLDEPPPRPTEPAVPSPPSDPTPFDPTVEEVDAWESPEDRFVPPPPPPLPRLPWPQRLAWLGVLGSPAALVVLLVSGLAVPRLLGYVLVAAFVGGFLYLVVTMRTGRDPWDDGARV